MVSMASTRVIHCELQSPPVPKQQATASQRFSSEQVKIILQPRMCTLRSYGPADREGGVIQTMTRAKDYGSTVSDAGEELMSPFFANLSEYIESTKKSQDFEIITGRLAMIVFAATIGVELTTGNSVFKKMDVQGITEGLGACLAAMTCAAGFAYSTSARKNVGRIFTLRCNALIDGLIDNIIDGLFYEDDGDSDDGPSLGKDL